MRDDRQGGVRLHRVGELEDGRQGGPERGDLTVDHAQVVHVERRTEPLREVLRVEPGQASAAEDLVARRWATPAWTLGFGRRRPRGGCSTGRRALRDRHRSAPSRATRASVPGSRSLTMTAVATRQAVAARERPAQRPRPGHHDRPRGHGERGLRRPFQDALADEVVQPRRAREGDPRAEHGFATHENAVQQGAAGTHERAVLDDDRPGARRLQNAADEDTRRKVDPGSDLGAGADEDERVDHRVLADPGPDVDERGRHDDDARAEVDARLGRSFRRARSATGARPPGPLARRGRRAGRARGSPTRSRKRNASPTSQVTVERSEKRARIAAFTAGSTRQPPGAAGSG